MIRNLIVCILIALASAVPSIAAEAPVTYTLDACLNRFNGFDVDEFGRIYITDASRHATMRFEADGSLDASWLDEYHTVQYPQARCGLSVIQGKRTALIGPGAYLNNFRKVGPNPNDDVIIAMPDEDYRVGVGALSDGAFFTYRNVKLDKKVIEVYNADSKLISTFERPKCAAMSLGPDGIFYVLADKPLLLTYDLHGKKLQRTIDVSAAFPTNSTVGAGILTISANGDIYIQDAFTSLKRLSSKGVLLNIFPYRAVADSNEKDGELKECASGLRVRNGLVYVLLVTYQYIVRPSKDVPGNNNTTTRFVSSRIVVHTPDGRVIAQYVPKTGELKLPSSLAVQSDGSYAVVMHGMDSVAVFDSADKKLGQQATGRYTQCVAARPSGGFYCGAYDNASIISANGDSIRTIFENDYKKMDENETPVQMTINPSTNHMWAMSYAGVLQEYGPDDKIIKSLPANLDLNTQDWSTGMAIDKDGFVYLPDSRKHRIIKASLSGKLVTTWGSKGSGIGELRYPEGMAIDSKGRLYVADCENSRIQMFTTDGKPLGVWGKFGYGEGELNRPFGLAIGPNDTLWISDTFNDRIVKIPLSKFWSQVQTVIVPEPVLDVKKEPEPTPGEVTVTGIVVAGTDDFTDHIYIESPDRLWGTQVTLPPAKQARRGQKIKVTGQLKLKDRAAKHITARTADVLEEKITTPGPLGMSNQLVGDGYGSQPKKITLPNLGLLVRTWGRVISVNQTDHIFVINDGSYPIDKGLIIYAGDTTQTFTQWPQKGQYVGVTGLSITCSDSDGTLSSGVRIRDNRDIHIFKE